MALLGRKTDGRWKTWTRRFVVHIVSNPMTLNRIKRVWKMNECTIIYSQSFLEHIPFCLLTRPLWFVAGEPPTIAVTNKVSHTEVMTYLLQAYTDKRPSAIQPQRVVIRHFTLTP